MSGHRARDPFGLGVLVSLAGLGLVIAVAVVAMN